jgi:hypothetical protein
MGSAGLNVIVSVEGARFPLASQAPINTLPVTLIGGTMISSPVNSRPRMPSRFPYGPTKGSSTPPLVSGVPSNRRGALTDDPGARSISILQIPFPLAIGPPKKGIFVHPGAVGVIVA